MSAPTLPPSSETGHAAEFVPTPSCLKYVAVRKNAAEYLREVLGSDPSFPRQTPVDGFFAVLGYEP
jgi:hypothetical protein